MFLKDLKQKMILPNREILINKTVKIRGLDVQLISITSQEHRNVLWAMYQLPCPVNAGMDLEERIEYTSNRDEMTNNISKYISSPPNIYISEIMIQNQKMSFISSSSSPMHDMNYEGYMQLQHFIENGMVTTNWNEVNLANIVIAAYKQNESEEFPTVDLSKKLDITLKVNKELTQVPINQSIRLEFAEIEKGKKFSFYDSTEKKTRTFYIDRMKHYDIWDEVNHDLDDELAKVLPEEQIEQMKKDYLTFLEKTCPKGMNLAMLEYETEDDVQLYFYSKEYLDEKPAQKTSSSSAMFFTSDKKLGTNGFKTRTCMIKPVQKGFNGIIDVELFSYLMVIPEETITV
ncbi:hypothetical protein [Clostridium sp.]|uniref:hypothetical protein n=1 Tax=Clostridium sp. TaxID=1506 RepID=UPI001A5F44D2|nr:hypothetical protein [Clostridium sp.]MBK5237361.1 hypothetical protein [Clostridium sp.]